ncbi:MAG: hypothetical protein HC831_08890 [Chloroflexia bacterium]|nr:hypothetical protein [Chloroflexia bacterium]
MFPNSANVYDSFGEVLMKTGKHDLAIQNYKKSLELNPQNSNAADMLKLIEEEKKNERILRTRYFGQKTPDTIPELFAPGIVSINGQYEYGVSFSPDLNEIYYSVEKEGDRASVYYSKLVGNNWTRPQKANFTKGKKQAEMEAFVAPDGKKVFFTAYDSMNVKIWYADRTPTGWGEAKKLDSPINNDIVFYSTLAANGDIYYTNISKRKQYFAPCKNGKYPEVFEAGNQFGGHGFISPNKDILLVDAFKIMINQR